MDKKNSDACRYSRLAGQKRGDKTQELLAVNIGCKTFLDWVEDIKFQQLKSEVPPIIPITDFERPAEDSPNELIKHRFLDVKASP